MSENNSKYACDKADKNQICRQTQSTTGNVDVSSTEKWDLTLT